MKFKVTQEYTATDSCIIEADTKEKALALAQTDDYCNMFVNDSVSCDIIYNIYEVKD